MAKTIVPVEDSNNSQRVVGHDHELAPTLSKLGDRDSADGCLEPHARPPRHSLALERRCIEMLYRRIGCPAVQLRLWDGSSIGDGKAAVGQIKFTQPRVIWRLFRHSLLGFCEGYMDHEIEVEGDLIEVLTELNRGLGKAHSAVWKPRFPRWSWSRHSIAESKQNVQSHYDLGNDFYRLWLDSQLVYTCAYYGHPDSTLDEAQTAKLDFVCRKLRLKPDETVVDAGCGWGALALHMARNYGVKVRAYNLSCEQLDYARFRARSEQLDNRIEFIEDDYRNITAKCDAFASVGMLEHVGVENYRGLGQLIDRVLTTEGRGLIHSIGRNFPKPLDPWTVKYIFPGAYVASLSEMMTIFEGANFSVCDVENLRQHYARTCADWLVRFERVADAVRKMFDERFVRMWRLYLAAASAAFVNGDLQLFQIVFARANNNLLPMTREDWYS
jgi:cyclopropane-fatty-acyl-phospholipid synthase